jgi:hypothetical protein
VSVSEVKIYVRALSSSDHHTAFCECLFSFHLPMGVACQLPDNWGSFFLQIFICSSAWIRLSSKQMHLGQLALIGCLPCSDPFSCNWSDSGQLFQTNIIWSKPNNFLLLTIFDISYKITTRKYVPFDEQNTVVSNPLTSIFSGQNSNLYIQTHIVTCYLVTRQIICGFWILCSVY